MSGLMNPAKQVVCSKGAECTRKPEHTRIYPDTRSLVLLYFFANFFGDSPTCRDFFLFFRECVVYATRNVCSRGASVAAVALFGSCMVAISDVSERARVHVSRLCIRSQ